ncbi:hypothetical protein C8J57DRAFT_1164989 [Mycena rebaudengoi]|nr:hypothetical protein C8J57DRAFT_1164989 [Mycena rebaudengoi]
MYFHTSMIGHVGGEEIWCVLNRISATLYHVADLAEAAQTYSILLTLIKMVILNDWDSFACWKNKTGCLQTIENPTGIPAYKMFSFYFWPYPSHPLGQKWVLSPEPTLSNQATTYLGYSVEDACSLTQFVPPTSRTNRAWILSKRLSYLSPGKEPAWTADDFNAASSRTGVEFSLGAELDDGQTRPAPDLALPHAYTNHGRMNKTVFMSNIAQSKILIGIGNPIVSPTPYDALCLGVPFINPLDQWDEKNPLDSSKWHGQHHFASILGKPYVYNVRRGDREGFVQAIREALANPIGLYVPERMRMPSLERRIEEIIDHDWEAEEKKQAEWCHESCGCTQPCDLS